MAKSLEEMIVRWEGIAKSAAAYNLTLDDWLNDIDLRDMIARGESSPAFDARLRSRLASADRAFRVATVESQRSLWGPTAGAEHRATTHWWYFRYPSSPGAELRRELRSAGVLPN
jgi:hypothetical protein